MTRRLLIPVFAQFPHSSFLFPIMSTAKAQELPERTVKFRFPKVPDFTDAAYDRTNPEHFVRAWDQRLRESYVGYASMIELQDKLFHCALKSGVNSRAWCKDLSDEYMRRLKCPNHTCGEVSYSISSSRLIWARSAGHGSPSLLALSLDPLLTRFLIFTLFLHYFIFHLSSEDLVCLLLPLDFFSFWSALSGSVGHPSPFPPLFSFIFSSGPQDLIFKDRVYFKDFSPVATPDPSLEDRWQRFNTRAYAPEKSSDSKSE